jgi:hypothetical protein
MKNNVVKSIVLILMLSVVSVSAYAQFIEDGLRLGAPGLGVGARSLGMGTAFTAVANDFSAAYWNPAGLGQIRMNEVSFGLNNLSYGNTSSFFNNDQSTTNSATNLNSVGLVYTAPTVQGSLVFALGYGRQSEFTTGLSFSGFNPKSSIIQSWAANGSAYSNSDLASNIAYQLYLANIDTVLGTFISPIMDSLTQSGKVLEGGGLNYYTISAAVEATRNVYLGLTLNFISGSYSYTRNYYEDDLKNIYGASKFPFDFTSLSVYENVESDISGFTSKLGFLYTPNAQNKLGITVKTPSWITVRETFTSKITSDFDSGNPSHFEFPSVDVAPDKNEYNVKTPFSFSGGFSFGTKELTLAGDLEYTDWTQLEFSSSGSASSDFNNHLNNLNQQVKDNFQSTLNIRAGAEVGLPGTDVTLRGGFIYLPSPYKIDSSPNAQKFITGGLGFLFDNSIALDLAYAHGFWQTSHVNYNAYDQNNNALSQTKEEIRTNSILGTISYRF